MAVCVINWSESALFDRRASYPTAAWKKLRNHLMREQAWALLETTFLEAEGRTRRTQEHIREMTELSNSLSEKNVPLTEDDRVVC